MLFEQRFGGDILNDTCMIRIVTRLRKCQRARGRHDKLLSGVSDLENIVPSKGKRHGGEVTVEIGVKNIRRTPSPAGEIARSLWK